MILENIDNKYIIFLYKIWKGVAKMNIKISNDKIITNIDDLFNYLLKVEGLVDFIYGTDQMNEEEVKDVIFKFIDHYKYCISTFNGFKGSISKVNYNNKYREDRTIFENLKSYILRENYSFCNKIVQSLDYNQSKDLLERFIYEYSGIKRRIEELR